MAEDPDELECNFDPGQSRMEITTVLLVGWAIFCVLLVALGRYVNRRFLQPPGDDVKKAKTASAPPAATQNATTETPANATDAAVAAKIKTTEALQAKPKTKSTKKKPVLPPGVTKGEIFSAPLPSPGGGAGAVALRDATAPFATGSDKDAVNWVNDLLQWLYTDPTPTPYLQSTWIKTLNTITGKLEPESGVKVQFQEIGQKSTLPLMVNVMADPGPNDNNINILSDIESQELEFIVQVTRQTGDNFWSTEYTCQVDVLSGPLSVACNTDTTTGTVHFDCKPKIALKLITSPRSEMDDPVDEHALQAVVNEIISNSLTNAAPEVDVNKFPRCPRFIRKQMLAERVIPVHYDSMIPVITPAQPKKISKRGKRIFVKIIKANQLGSDKGCTAPMCTVELDEPTQKHSTGVNEGINPFWDEHFLFDLNNASAELLFEVWDKSQQVNKGNRFLGLGIISVDDLLRNPSQKQIIPLQSRPYEGDDISGSLTVDFLCMESVDIPVETEKSIETSKVERERPPRPPLPSPTKISENQKLAEEMPVAPKRQHAQHAPAIVVNGEDMVTSTALRELSKSHSPTETAKSTLIIHSVQRPSDKLGTVQALPAAPIVTDPTNLPQEAGDRSRSKERKSFMSTLKKRLSFRRKRSRSVDQQQSSSSRDSSVSRSTSVDRAQSMPGSHGDNASSRSSLSEMSGFSGSSAQTYVDDASMLVIEAVENGITKHYLIPTALASNRKWRRRGTKLHIFNDHTFVAKHLSSNITCQVCAKVFVRRIGKQGYECRDCQLKCHKPCHVRTDTHCPASSVGTMELLVAFLLIM
uniref:Phorbol-ester/DAG-type domain-containing protein n=1 Tax=Strigamia maritima TaxID=126957 RepID=T1IVR3_STRMM